MLCFLCFTGCTATSAEINAKKIDAFAPMDIVSINPIQKK